MGVPVDGHVHYHASFELEAFLDGAVRNLAAGARQLGLEGEADGVLMLTESAGARFFADVRDGRSALPAGWRSESTGEAISLRLTRRDGRRLLLLSGRQVVTGEGLEVLALGVEAELPDGRSLDASVRATLDAGGLPVVPWGFGKWWLSRGRLVRRAVAAARPGELFLGDNGGRLAAWPEPRLFDEARARSIAVLPGSDPLPLSGHERRAGSYGFALPAPLDAPQPGATLLSVLRALAAQPLAFGTLERPLAFVRNQVAMQVVKRRRRADA